MNYLGNNIQFDQSIYKKLSSREIEAVRAAKEGLSMKETAEKMGIAFETVKSFRKRAMRKLGCNSTTSAVVALINAGIL